MSIHSEFDRYVQDLLSALRDPAAHGDAALLEELQNYQDTREDLSIRAERLLETLESEGFHAWLEQPSNESRAKCRDLSERLLAISKIILGQ